MIDDKLTQVVINPYQEQPKSPHIHFRAMAEVRPKGQAKTTCTKSPIAKLRMRISLGWIVNMFLYRTYVQMIKPFENEPHVNMTEKKKAMIAASFDETNSIVLTRVLFNQASLNIENMNDKV